MSVFVGIYRGKENAEIAEKYHTYQFYQKNTAETQLREYTHSLKIIEECKISLG